MTSTEVQNGGRGREGKALRTSATIAFVSLLVLCVYGPMASSAHAAASPVIESESASHITATDATLEAQINTGGTETTYEVWVGNYPECIEEGGPQACESSSDHPITATIAGSSSPTTISVNVGTAWRQLSPNSEYIYHVDATNSNWAFEGSAYGPNEVFKTRSAKAPVIEAESISRVTPTDATLEAQINTEGLETSYQFRLESGCLPPLACLAIATYPLPSGTLLGSFIGQSVSLDLNSAGVTLQPDTRYRYSVQATNSAGTAEGEAHIFTALPSNLPTIEAESVSHVTSTGATLEAQVNPNGHNDWAQFQLVEEPSSYASGLLCPEPPWPGFSGCVGPHSATALPLEFVPGNAAHPEPFEIVSLDLASAGVTLKPGTTYHYRLLAAPAVQTEDTIQWEEPTIFGADQTFTTASDPPMADASSASNQPAPTWSVGPALPRRHHHRRHHRRRNHRSAHRSVRGR